MRKVIDLQMEFWEKDIDNIEFDLQSRDEIPKLLMGLQYIYRTTCILTFLQAINILNSCFWLNTI
jgi:hypothetical protein